MNLSYKESGVSIDAGNDLVEKIKPIVKSTSRTGSNPDIGGFGGLFDLKPVGYKDPILVAATDGVGTKLKIANITNQHSTIGIDLVAMCVNDLIVQGAEPLFFLDYFATGKLDIDEATSVIAGIAEGCKQANCALIGGETAEMPGMYKAGDYDLAGFSVGAVERNSTLPSNDLQDEDIILGLPSSGVHSNGFSLVRYILEKNNISYDSKIPELNNITIGNALLEPTKIYVNTCLPLIKSSKIKALAHITGGGLTENIPRILPNNLSANIDCESWKLPPLFNWIRKQGNISSDEMLRVFNCGIGMVLIVSKDRLKDVEDDLNNSNEEYYILGKLQESLEPTINFINIEKFDD